MARTQRRRRVGSIRRTGERFKVGSGQGREHLKDGGTVRVGSIRHSGWAVLSHLNRPPSPPAHVTKKNENRVGRLTCGDKVTPTDVARHIAEPRQPAASTIGSRTAIDTVLGKVHDSILGSHSLLSGVLSHSITAYTSLQSIAH